VFVALAGVLWGHGALALGVLVLPKYLSYGDAVRLGVAYRVVVYTALLPWTLADRCREWVSGQAVVAGVRLAADPELTAVVLAPLVACGLAFAIDRACRSRKGRLVCTALCVAGLSAAAILALQLADGVSAEREFFALVSQNETPHQSPSTVAGARRFLAEHRYSRWRSEALRIEAMAAEEAGDDLGAERTWQEFGASFGDPTVPGVAYAEYSRARCWERLGWPQEAARHYRRAVAIIAARDDGIQDWIGSDGTQAIARIERESGRILLAEYWTERTIDASAKRRD